MRVTEFRLQNCVDIEDSGWVVVEGGIAPRPIGRKTWQVLVFLRDVLDSDQPDHDLIRLTRPTSPKDELQDWVFELGLDWDNFKGETKRSKTVALLTELERKGHLGKLVALVRRDRPDLSF